MTTQAPPRMEPRPRRTPAQRKAGSPARPAPAAGFTLVELLVVIVIIGIVAAVAFPVLDRLTQVTQGGAGTAAVESAVNTARIVNSRLAHPSVTPSMFPNANMSDVDYQGTAVLFTPSGEMRIIWHDPNAVDQATGDPLELDGYHGYVDVAQLDYLRIPRSSYFAGVQWIRGSIRFVPPPFVVRFDSDARMRSPYFHRTDPSLDDAAIIYAGDHDGDDWVFDSTRTLSGGYQPSEWDARDPDAGVLVTGDGRTVLPADVIPVVSAVVLFESRQFREQPGVTWDDWNTPNSNLHDFLTNPDFTRSIYFSPQTGRMMRGLTDGTRR